MEPIENVYQNLADVTVRRSFESAMRYIIDTRTWPSTVLAAAQDYGAALFKFGAVPLPDHELVFQIGPYQDTPETPAFYKVIPIRGDGRGMRARSFSTAILPGSVHDIVALPIEMRLPFGVDLMAWSHDLNEFPTVKFDNPSIMKDPKAVTWPTDSYPHAMDARLHIAPPVALSIGLHATMGRGVGITDASGPLPAMTLSIHRETVAAAPADLPDGLYWQRGRIERTRNGDLKVSPPRLVGNGNMPAVSGAPILEVGSQ